MRFKAPAQEFTLSKPFAALRSSQAKEQGWGIFFETPKPQRPPGPYPAKIGRLPKL